MPIRIIALVGTPAIDYIRMTIMPFLRGNCEENFDDCNGRLYFDSGSLRARQHTQQHNAHE